ncbi:hypothetical protein A2U01_0046614, partial [Trifolium medium]|nr:hypothetical protein [Trifolium medium]
AAGTNSTQPSIEIKMKETEDQQPNEKMNEPHQEILEQQVNQPNNEMLDPNFESTNSCMGDSNAKNQDASNVESLPLKEVPIPEIIPEVETVVEETKETEVDMSDPKGQEIPTTNPSTSSPKDKKSSSTDGINLEDMISDSYIPTRSGGSS